MKTLRVPLAFLLLTGSLAFAQAPVPEAGATAETAPAPALRTPQELEQLLAPIALYPDALIAMILPASAVPADIVLAARYLRDSSDDRSQVENRAWDDSVKSLTNYPEVVKWMDENLSWTKQLGEAFATQPADVMSAIQRLRAQASAAGTLTNTPQQQVIAEPDVIRIVPAQPDVIYVPSYEPSVVFVDRPVYYASPFLTFGVGVPVGSWLAFDCDWRRHTIWVGNRHRPWTAHDWHQPIVAFGPTYSGPRFARTVGVRQWRPPVAFRSSVTLTHYTPRPIIQPSRFNPAIVHNHGPRPAIAEIRPSPALQTQTVDGAVTRPNGFGRREVAGPRTWGSRTPAPSVPTANFAPPAAPTTPVAETSTPTPAQHRSDWARQRENRGRTNPGTAATPAAPTVTFAPSVNMPPSPPPAAVPGPTPGPRYSGHAYQRYAGSNSAALAAPPATSVPAPAAPARTYSHPHYNPPAPSAPAPAAAPAPQSAPAQAQPARSEAPASRGYRGRRENER